MISFLLMFLTYPKIENVVLISEESRAVRDFISQSDQFNIEIAISKLVDIKQFKIQTMDLTKEHNIDLYFTDYATENKNSIHIYAYFSNQDLLDKLPIKPSIEIDTFNNLEHSISNNDLSNSYIIDILPTTKYEHQYSSFQNYSKGELVGELIISGNEDNVMAFLNDFNKIDNLVFSYNPLFDLGAPLNQKHAYKSIIF